MGRILILAALLGASVFSAFPASPAVHVTAGLLACGASQSATNQVQTWCWLGASTTLLYNATYTLPAAGGSTVATYSFLADTITWKFTLSGGILSYSVTANGNLAVGGTFGDPSTGLRATCDPGGPIEPGQSAICTVTIDQPASGGGFQVTVILPAELTGPSSVMIPPGAVTATFTMSRAEDGGAALRILPGTYELWGWPDTPMQSYAELMIPCCGRADGCGLPASQIAPEPCAN
jgi:hypothetical protein